MKPRPRRPPSAKAERKPWAALSFQSDWDWLEAAAERGQRIDRTALDEYWRAALDNGIVPPKTVLEQAGEFIPKQKKGKKHTRLTARAWVERWLAVRCFEYNYEVARGAMRRDPEDMTEAEWRLLEKGIAAAKFISTESEEADPTRGSPRDRAIAFTVDQLGKKHGIKTTVAKLDHWIRAFRRRGAA